MMILQTLLKITIKQTYNSLNNGGAFAFYGLACHNLGIDGNKGKICDMKELKIFDTLAVKKQTLKTIERKSKRRK